MAEIVRDQAEGLRRMFARSAVRSITLTGGQGAGKTSVAINLAAAFARRGRRTLLLDEASGAGGSAAYLGLRPQWDLWHVMRGQKKLREVMLAGPAGVMLAPAGKAVAALDEVSVAECDAWIATMAGWEGDVVLVDAAGGVSSLSLAAQETIVVVSAGAEAITEAYATIKAHARDFARQRFHILVNRVKSQQQAEAVFASLDQAMRRFLNISPHYLGMVPHDEEMRRSARLRLPVVEAYRGAQSAAAFGEVVDAIEQWPYPEETCLEDFMQRLIGGSRLSASMPL
ncbi:MAG: MinD/ParA family protein [Pseudomonadota bacterium]